VKEPVLRTRRVLVALGLIVGVWAAVLFHTHGFRVVIGDLPISSRNPWSALEVALLIECAAVALSPWVGGLAGWRAEWAWWSRLARETWRRYAQIMPALAVVIVVSAYEIHRWLGAAPLWLDEETIALNVRDRSLTGLAGALWLGQSAPLGWLILVGVVIRALGTSELALRLVPLLFGIAVLAAALWVGRRWLGVVGAVALAWLCGFSHWLSHFASEAKHYTADAFGALILPALVVYAIEAKTLTERRQRAVAWWIAAAVGLWLSNGATLATPALAVLLVAAMWRIDGRRAALFAVIAGGMWLASFALHYQLSARYTVASSYLHEYWAPEMPAASLGALGRAEWTLERLPALAGNPGGTDLWISFWACAAAGFVLGRRRWLGLAFGSVPVAAMVLGALGLVPLADRLALWMAPALYVGIALLVDRAADLARHAFPRRQWVLVAVAVGTLMVGVRLLRDVYDRGEGDLLFTGAFNSNHALDDRSAVRWLIAQHAAGDVVMTTHLAWPAVWWYGNLPLADPSVAGAALADGTRFYEIDYSAPGSDCRLSALGDALRGRRRALLYVGFPDVPIAYDTFLVDRVSALGTITDMKTFAELSLVVVVDLTGDGVPMALRDRPAIRGRNVPALEGCIGVRPALRW
jgi:hypothetical protein